MANEIIYPSAVVEYTPELYRDVPPIGTETDNEELPRLDEKTFWEIVSDREGKQPIVPGKTSEFIIDPGQPPPSHFYGVFLTPTVALHGLIAAYMGNVPFSSNRIEWLLRQVGVNSNDPDTISSNSKLIKEELETRGSAFRKSLEENKATFFSINEHGIPGKSKKSLPSELGERTMANQFPLKNGNTAAWYHSMLKSRVKLHDQGIDVDAFTTSGQKITTFNDILNVMYKIKESIIDATEFQNNIPNSFIEVEIDDDFINSLELKRRTSARANWIINNFPRSLAEYSESGPADLEKYGTLKVTRDQTIIIQTIVRAFEDAIAEYMRLVTTEDGQRELYELYGPGRLDRREVPSETGKIEVKYYRNPELPDQLKPVVAGAIEILKQQLEKGKNS